MRFRTLIHRFRYLFPQRFARVFATSCAALRRRARGHRGEESRMTKWGMLIDLKRCAGCGACVVACQLQNNQSPGVSWVKLDTVEWGEAQARRDALTFRTPACTAKILNAYRSARPAPARSSTTAWSSLITTRASPAATACPRALTAPACSTKERAIISTSTLKRPTRLTASSARASSRNASSAMSAQRRGFRLPACSTALRTHASSAISTTLKAT